MNKNVIIEYLNKKYKNNINIPLVDESEYTYVKDCLDNRTFSRFVGSPTHNYREVLNLKSSESIHLKDDWTILGGKYVRLFENECSKLLNSKYVVYMNSATSCITAAMISLGLKPNDEVITTPLSFTASATGVFISGIKIRFADVDSYTFCLDVDSIKNNISKNTKAIMPVHLLGNAGHIEEINNLCKQNGLLLVEDSSQALMGVVNSNYLGTIGSIGIFSFQETKNMMTGEGGIAVTNNEKLAKSLRLIRNHGEAMVEEGVDTDEDIRKSIGYNFRPTEISAALGYAQIKKIHKINNIRKSNYDYIYEKLHKKDYIKFQNITNDKNNFYPYHIGFTFNTEDFGITKYEYANLLKNKGIGLTTGFPRLLNENPLYKDSKIYKNSFDLNYKNYLGFVHIGYPNTEKQMQEIVDAINFIEKNKSSVTNYIKSI